MFLMINGKSELTVNGTAKNFVRLRSLGSKQGILELKELPFTCCGSEISPSGRCKWWTKVKGCITSIANTAKV
jgi:hypothetical protein